MEIKKVSMIGMGAIGCSVAPGLFKALGNGFRVIADEKRKSKLESGIVINDETYKFPVVSPEEKGDEADLVILAVKYGHLEQAIVDIENQVGPNTMIMSLLNGISSEGIIAKHYGEDRMIYSLTSINAVMKENVVKVSLDSGEFMFGEKENIISERVKAIAKLFEEAKLPYSIPENIEYAIWKKYLINTSINPIAAVMRAKNGFFQDLDSMKLVRKSIINEVQKVSIAVGVCLTDEDCEEILTVSKNYNPNGKCSMLQDVEAGRKTEKDMFLGTLIELGEKYNVDVPIAKFLYHMISVVEEANEKGMQIA